MLLDWTSDIILIETRAEWHINTLRNCNVFFLFFICVFESRREEVHLRQIEMGYIRLESSQGRASVIGSFVAELRAMI
jgi:hypothetical protein